MSTTAKTFKRETPSTYAILNARFRCWSPARNHDEFIGLGDTSNDRAVDTSCSSACRGRVQTAVLVCVIRKRATTTFHQAGSHVLLLEYARQQRWSFGLLWSTLAIAVILTTALIGRVVAGPVAGFSALQGLTGLGLDACLAGGAGHLYRISSRRLEKAVKELDRLASERPST